MAVEKLIVDHIDTWTTALQTRSTAGRGSSGKIDLYGIKKLRELILELAVRGKLVPQDSNDEPASVLLERIAAEKAELVKLGKIKKPKPLPEISEEEKPFELPAGWEWVRFGSIYDMEYGNNLPQEKRSNSGEYNVYGSNGIVGTHNEACIKSPCIVIGRKGSAGALNLSDQSACWVTDVAYSTIPPSAMNLEFVFIQFHTLGLDTLGKGIKPGLNRNDAYNLTIAIPPQSEQKTIVSKVNELMALCDQLEQHSLSSLDAHQQLVETLLTTLTDSQNADELAENWARISEHFDTLFTTEVSIDALKQTILQLAVMGKLVPQDPNDEPASELLKRIAQEKALLVKDGKIKKQKPLPPISDEEKPFELPTGWSLAHFGDIAIEIATGPFGSMIHQSDYILSGVPLINPSHIVNSKIVIDPAISVSTEFAESLSSYKMVAGNIVMARRGEMGRCAVVTTKENGYLCGTGSFILKFSDEIDKDYIVELFKTVYVRNYLGGNSVGSTMTNLNHSILNKMPIHLPPVRMQSKIVAAITSFSAYCENLKSQIQSAQQTQLHLADALTDAAIN
ncbi:restriction endonuclease subunit S [Salmonella enterica]